jgi:hypothetical protein
VAGEPVDRKLTGGSQNRERDREVEAGALLSEAGGSEIDGDAARRPLELGRRDPAADPVLRLLAGAVCQPDDRETGHAVLEVRLDLHLAGLQPDERMRDGAPKHASTLRLEVARVCNEIAPALENRL